MASPAVDYAALAAQARGAGAPPSANPPRTADKPVDYAALAKQARDQNAPTPAADAGGTVPGNGPGNDGRSPMVQSAIDAAKGYGDYAHGVVQGFGRSAASGVAGVAHLANAVTGHNLSQIPGYDHAVSKIEEEGDRHTPGVGGAVGALGENILEFMSGDELLSGAGKAVSVGEHVQKLGKVADTLAKHPAIARVVGSAIKNGTLGGAQTLLHGGSAEDAEKAALMTGGGGAALDTAMEGVAGLARGSAPVTKTIGGVDVPALRPAKPGTGSVSTFQGAQQQAARDVQSNLAQRATRQSLERLNVGRGTAETNPARLLPAPAGPAKPYEFHVAGPDPVTETQTPPTNPGKPRQYQTAGSRDYQVVPPSGAGVEASGSGTHVVTDPHQVATNLSQLTDMMGSPRFAELPAARQAAITNEAQSLSKQLSDHGAYRARMSHFEPIDPVAATRHVTSYGEGAEVVRRAAGDVFSRADKASSGELSRLHAQEQAARSAYRAGSDEAGDTLAGIHARQDAVWQSPEVRGKLSPAELGNAYKAYGDSKVMDDWHDAFERGAYAGQKPADTAARLGEQRTMAGGPKLTQNLKRVLDRRGAESVDRVIGQDARDNAFQLADTMDGKNAPQAKGIFDGISSLARHHHTTAAGITGSVAGGGLGLLVGHPFLGASLGSSAGIGGEYAARRLMQRLATDPKIAGRFTYAAEHGVSSRIAAPLIAAMMNGNIGKTGEDAAMK